MIRTAAVSALLLLGELALAQVPLPPTVDPGAIQQRQIEEERRRQELERLRRQPETAPLKKPEAPPTAVKPGAADVRFMARRIEFTESEILKREELDAIAREYEGKEVSLADLQRVVDRVNELYRARGVVTARAILPAQDVTTGTVRIRLVEGRYGTTRIEGNASTSAAYVKWRIDDEPGRLVDLQQLERELIRFNRTTDVQLRAELKPGTSFGTTDLNLTLAEPPRHELRFFADNAGSKSTGEARVGTTYLNRNVLGFRDDASLSLTRADGHEGYSASYGVPFNRWGGRITAAWYKDLTEVKHGPLAVLKLTGESEATIISLRQPLYVGRSLQLDLTGGWKKRDTANWISGVFLQGTKTEDGSLGAEVQSIDGRGYWLANYSWSAGHAEVAATRRNYAIGRGSVRRLQDLAPGWSLRGNLTFQHTADELLPSSEQFFIGGEGTVRGYPVGAYAGDEGYIVNVELHHPLVVLGPGKAPELTTTGFFFLDYGHVSPYRPPNSVLRSYEELSGIGWGVNAYLGKHVYARVTAAYALNDLPLEPRRYVIHFQLVASIF